MSDRTTRVSGGLRPLLIQAVKFFGGTLIGLTVDFGIYSIAVAFGMEPGASNALSSSFAVVVMYFVSSRLVFGARRHPLAFLAFCAWYAASIIAFSFAVQFVHDTFGLAPLWAKVATLPFSFVANFIAVRLILFRGREVS